MSSQALSVLALCILLVGASAQSTSGNTVGSLLDSLQNTVQNAASDSSSTLNDLLTQASDATSGTDLSQFVTAFQNAKCPVDAASAFSASQVAKVKSACANPPASASGSFCATCYCAYYQLLMSTYMNTGNVVSAQSGSSPDIMQSVSMMKCLADAGSALVSALGTDAGAAVESACSNLASSESFAMQVYTQCGNQLTADDTTSVNSVTASPAATAVSSPKPSTTTTTTTATSTTVPATTISNSTTTSSTNSGTTNSSGLTGTTSSTTTNNNTTGAAVLRNAAGVTAASVGSVIFAVAAVLVVLMALQMPWI